MEQRHLGRSGLTVSVVGLGCNNFGGRIDLEATRRVVYRAIDCGITLFDTADIYGEQGGSESALGGPFPSEMQQTQEGLGGPQVVTELSSKLVYSGRGRI